MNSTFVAVTYCTMTAKKKPKLTTKQWQKTLKALEGESDKIPGPTLSSDSLEMAKLHLVDGLSLPSIAEKYGVSKQNVHQITTRLYNFYIRYVAGYPASWQETIIAGPPEFIKKVKLMEKEIHKKLLH